MKHEPDAFPPPSSPYGTFASPFSPAFYVNARYAFLTLYLPSALPLLVDAILKPYPLHTRLIPSMILLSQIGVPADYYVSVTTYAIHSYRYCCLFYVLCSAVW